MTIGIITANLGRPRILQIFCAGIKRLREDTGLDIPVVCVGDIGGKIICEDYGIEYISHPNKPLTGKFNKACEALKDKVDYVMVMGSDNIISTETFNRIHAEAEKGIDLIGADSVYFYGMDSVYTGRLYQLVHTTVLGVGRTVSADVLRRVNWHPWGEERDRAIDRVMLDTVRPYVKTRSLLSDCFIVDLKTSFNLNRIEFWSERLPQVDTSILYDNIGQEEAELIRQYIKEQE